MELKNSYKLDKILATDNVVDVISEEDCKIIGETVVREFDIDDGTRDAWKEQYRAAHKLAMQVMEPKTSPWPGAANVKFPLLTIASLQFQSRAYAQLVDTNELVKCKVIGDDPQGLKNAHAERVSTFMSYQLLEQDEHWEEDTDRLLMILPIVGCVIRKTYYDAPEGHVCSQMIMPEDFVVSYYTKNLEQAPRATHILHQSLREIQAKQIAGVYADVTLVQQAEDQTNELTQELKQDRGLLPPIDDPEKDREVLEQHRFLDLDGDGFFEPYVVTVDKLTSKCLRIFPRFTDTDIKRNKDDQIRTLATQTMQMMQAPLPEDPDAAQVEIGLRHQQAQAMEAEIEKLKKSSKIIYIEPIVYFTKYSFLPSPDGSFYDLGFGTLLGPINHTVDTIINQLVDSGTLQTSSNGFVSSNVRVRGGDLRFRPFEWKRADVGAGSLKEGLVPLPVNQPSAVLFSLLELLINYGERISSVTDMMVGETPGQNTPATTSMAALDQGMKVFSGILKRLYRGMKQEFRKVYRLNRVYLDPQEYFTVLGTNQQQVVFQQDFMGNPNEVVPEADPSTGSDSARVQRALTVKQMAAQTPGYNQQAVELWVLKEMKVPDLDELYPTNPPIPAQPSPDAQKIQIMAMEAQTKMLAEQANTKIAALKAQAEVENMRAQAALYLAQAQAAGAQMDAVKIDQQLAAFDSIHSHITDLMSAANDQQNTENDKEQIANDKQAAAAQSSGSE